MLRLSELLAAMELRQAMRNKSPSLKKQNAEGPRVEPFVRKEDSNRYITYHQTEKQYRN